MGEEGNGVECKTEYINVDHCNAECVEFGKGPSNQFAFFGYRGPSEEKPGWVKRTLFFYYFINALKKKI